MRTEYETDFDVERERAFREIIEQDYDRKLTKIPKSYHLDGVVEKDGVISAFYEIKCRDYLWNDFKTLMISALKIRVGIEWAETFDLPFMLFVQWKDRWGYCQIDKNLLKSCYLKVGGRTANTRDDADIEPVVHIPIERFIKGKDRAGV